jgi:hypothetical protein
MMNFTKHLIRIFPVIVLLLAQCSEPTPPGPITPPAADTTTHEYTWEYHLFGQSPVASSWFRDIYVESDENFWMVGHVEVDTFVTSARGNKTELVTAVHWDGKTFTAHAIDVMKISGSINTGTIYAIEGRNGSIYFMGAMSVTELRDELYSVHDLRLLNGKWAGYERMDKFRSGRIFIYGGPGFAAELLQDKPLGPMSFRQIPLNTELPVATFAEAAEDDYYLGLWWTKTSEYHFWRMRHGALIPLEFSRTSDGPRDFCTSLWVSDTYVYATTFPYLYRQCIADTSNRAYLNIYNDTGPGKPLGRPFRMTGRNDNDIFIVGDAGTVVHFNGKSFHLYKEIKETIPYGRLYDVAVTTDKVYLVGAGVVNGLHGAVLFIGTRKQSK